MNKKRIEDMTIEESKQRMERLAKDINQIISSAPTPEMRHELATEYLEWLKKMQKLQHCKNLMRKKYDIGEQNG